MDTAIIRRAVDLAATDGEFRIAARYWTGALRLVVGDQSHLLHLDNGAISHLDLDQSDPAPQPEEVILAGPADGWAELLAPLPRPFYQDIGGAQRHGFTLLGDPERRYQYYAALQRFIGLLRQAREEQP